jgi:hypothetical protein
VTGASVVPPSPIHLSAIAGIAIVLLSALAIAAMVAAVLTIPAWIWRRRYGKCWGVTRAAASLWRVLGDVVLVLAIIVAAANLDRLAPFLVDCWVPLSVAACQLPLPLPVLLLWFVLREGLMFLGPPIGLWAIFELGLRFRRRKTSPQQALADRPMGGRPWRQTNLNRSAPAIAILCKRRWPRLLIAGVAAAGLVGTWLYAYAGWYGFNVILRRGATFWVVTEADDPRLSDAMRLALRHEPVVEAAGPFEWREIDRGFAVAELPVVAEGREVDRLLLARIDPDRFRFVVRNAPAGNRELGDWMTELGAVLVINGSYFSRRGTPVTPLVSAGAHLGPVRYRATHGAFVASSARVGIRDLRGGDWEAALRDADDAFVSFPLLMAKDGSSRVTADWRWLANRSFVGEDNAGRIILGTTTDAFFSLDRLAAFLRMAPLELTMALNLDGGPVACQGIALAEFRRDFCGSWELATHDGHLEVLTSLVGMRRWGMPIVLAVLPK